MGSEWKQIHLLEARLAFLRLFFQEEVLDLSVVGHERNALAFSFYRALTD